MVLRGETDTPDSKNDARSKAWVRTTDNRVLHQNQKVFGGVGKRKR
jgi:hypothetical protein